MMTSNTVTGKVQSMSLCWGTYPMYAWLARQSSPCTEISPLVKGMRPGDGFEQGAFPGAVWADQRYTLAGFHDKREIFNCAALPWIAGAESADFQGERLAG